jgi:hypothetical protein
MRIIDPERIRQTGNLAELNILEDLVWGKILDSALSVPGW